MGSKSDLTQNEKLVLHAELVDGRVIEIGEFSDISVTELDEIVTKQMEYVKVVRCKDCKYRRTNDCPMRVLFDPKDDFFCASGEEKD